MPNHDTQSKKERHLKSRCDFGTDLTCRLPHKKVVRRPIYFQRMNRRSHKPTTMRGTKTKTTLACCTGLSLAALSNNSGSSVLAFAPPAAASTTGIRKRCQTHQSSGAGGTSTSTSLRMTELLLSDPTDSIDALSALSSSSTASSARGLLSSFLGDSSFVGLPAFLSTQSHQPHIQSLYLDYLPTDLLSTATRTLTSTATSTILDFSDTMDDPQVESELLTDVAHVALDLITFASPTRALLRLSLCVGRMLAIAADWVPDHYLHPEEWLFQGFMLTVSFGLLAKTALPVLPALLHQSTNRYGEKRAYGALFKRHGGLSWVQTKMILAGGGAEWFELEEGEVAVMMEEKKEEATNTNGGADGSVDVVQGHDGYLYWLQKGEAELLICSGDTCLSKERAVATASDASSGTSTSIDEVAILGELEFARKMQDQQSKAKAKQAAKNKKADKKTVKDAAVASAIPTEMASNGNANGDLKESSPNYISTTTTTKIRAGPSGATLLRLDATRLLKLMDDDDALADGIRSIVFAGMQDKLRRVMQEDNTGTTASDDKSSSIKSKKPVVPRVNDGMQPLYAAYEPYEHDF